jgi:YVTN family beta-propeller protein
MKRGTIKALSAGCIILSFFLCGLALLPQIVQATNTVTATITIPHYAFTLAITPDGKYAYVPELNNVAVISTATNKVTTTVNIDGSNGVAMSPNGKYAYITSSVSDPKTGDRNSVAVIRTSTNKMTTTIPLGGSPTGVTITPNGEYAYIAENDIINNEAAGVVSVINTATNAVTTRITVDGSPQAIAITPNGEYAYVASSGSATSIGSPVSNGTVSVINTSTNTVATTVTVGIGPQSVAITPDGAYAYITNGGSDSVSVIGTATNTLTTTITGLSTPYGVALTPNGEYAYVTEVDSENMVGLVSVINTATNAVTATVPLESYPYDVAITPNGAYAYIANGSNSTVSVISTGIGTEPTSSSSPAVPEFPSLLFIIPLIVSLFAVAAMLRHQKKPSQESLTKYWELVSQRMLINSHISFKRSNNKLERWMV